MTDTQTPPPPPPEPQREPAGHRPESWFQRPFSGAPKPAMFLTLAGILPFLITALVVIVTPEGKLFNATAYNALLTYAAVILGFLGGTRWGVEMVERPETTRWAVLVLAIIPPLLAWAVILIGLQPRATMAIFIAGFLAMLFWDLWSITRGTLPGWYASLRIIASSGAILSLLLVFWTRDVPVTQAPPA